MGYTSRGQDAEVVGRVVHRRGDNIRGLREEVNLAMGSTDVTEVAKEVATKAGLKGEVDVVVTSGGRVWKDSKGYADVLRVGSERDRGRQPG